MHHIEVDVTKSCKSRKKQQMLKNRIKWKMSKKLNFNLVNQKTLQIFDLEKIYEKLILGFEGHIF